MNPFVSALPGLLVRRHLDRLQASLQSLGERLREVVSQAVGEAVADAVRAFVRLLVATPTAPLSATPYADGLWEEQERSLWHDPYRSPWDDEEEELLSRDEDLPMSADRVETAGAARWSHAVSVGCQAAAWWLRRQTGRFPMGTTVVLGVVVSLAAFVAGPVVAATGVGVIGTALGLMRWAEGVAAGTRQSGSLSLHLDRSPSGPLVVRLPVSQPQALCRGSANR